MSRTSAGARESLGGRIEDGFRIFRDVRQVVLFFVDAVLINVALVSAFLLRFEGGIPAEYLHRLPLIMLYVSVVRLALLYLFGLYRGVWRYVGMDDLLAILKAITLGSGVIAASMFFWTDVGFPRSVTVVEWLLNVILLGGLRFSLRVLHEYNWRSILNPVPLKRVLIVGAGDAGEMVVRQMTKHTEFGYLPVGFIDDDPDKQGKAIHRVKILGTRDDLERLAQALRVEEIIIAIPSAPGTVVRQLVARCQRTRLKFKIVPGIKEIITGGVNINQIREVQVEDLLRREPITMDLEEVAGYIAGKRIMVTGAGGSIGSELCRQIASLGPARLILFGRGENSLYEIDTALSLNHPGLDRVLCIGTVRDERRVAAVFREYRPEVVFHAAAHKHVPYMELQPEEAVKDNILGTQIVARAAVEHGVQRFVFLSTDKAVNPASVMGASKRIAERIVQALNHRGDVTLVCVRFGNVLDSRGSVVPLFKRQIASGGPVTVTHPDVERYFMTIPEAVQLVIQAGAMARGGEVFILDMGEPVKIVDLARDLIALSGLEPGKDIKIEFIGLRPGEKLHEELLTAEEGVNATKHRHIFIARPAPLDRGRLLQGVEELARLAEKGDREGIVNTMRTLVPTYRPARTLGEMDAKAVGARMGLRDSGFAVQDRLRPRKQEVDGPGSAEKSSPSLPSPQETLVLRRPVVSTEEGPTRPSAPS
jgi:FlaA1/EpsC-like NDP-sugar epimerase